MSDPLLPYYEQELAFIRKLGSEFARAYPKIAGRLRMSDDSVEDPHVARMIESFAYLNARTRHKLDDDFPEITDALLGVLYPHYVAPIPSMAIAQFSLDRSQGKLTTGYQVPAESVLETEPIDGEPCRFRTCYPVTLWPVELISAKFVGRPFTAPAGPFATEAAAVLRLELRTIDAEVPFGQVDLDTLRFFLKGQSQHIYPLYELLHNSALEVVLASSPKDANSIRLGRQSIRQVGFERNEGMFPYPARSFLGYRLLTEYFSFPEKFLFFDLTGFRRVSLAALGNKLEIYIYLNRSLTSLEQNVSEDTFRLGCAPVVNLFRRRAEPIQLSHTKLEYRIIPDARHPLAAEIYSIERVTATSADGEHREYRPFYSFKHAAAEREQQSFWHSTRRPAVSGPEQVDHGTEVYLSLVDLGFNPEDPGDWTLDVETTCLNRDLPQHLDLGGGRSRLQLAGGGPVGRLVFLTPPTPTRRPALKKGALWRLISHLTLNHLSLTDEAEGAEALREILKLYDFADSDETRSMIDGILRVSHRRVVGRVGGDVSGGFCKGAEVHIHFDEERFTGSGVFLFACVLERFLGMYCTINSFSRLVATTKQREGELRRWSPRTGEKVLL